MINLKFKAMLTMLLVFASTAFAQTDPQSYQAGHGALEVFSLGGEAMENTPQWVRIWMMIMAASFIAGLFFVWRHPIARWVVGGFLAGAVLGGVLTSGFGLLPLSGLIALIHIVCWSPALYQLLTKRPFLGERSAFSIWSGIITFVIIFSFIFDVRDAAIYLNHML